MWKVFFVALRLYGVLPDDEYGISFVDLGSMIEEFSGGDPRELDKAINKLTSIKLDTIA